MNFAVLLIYWYYELVFLINLFLTACKKSIYYFWINITIYSGLQIGAYEGKTEIVIYEKTRLLVFFSLVFPYLHIGYTLKFPHGNSTCFSSFS